MAELVEFNLEKHIKFFNELKKFIDEKQIKDFVRQRKHFEYKIASQNREYKSFESYIKHECKVLKILRDLKIPDGGTSLITDQKNLIERLVRQITIHFQYMPKVFFFAIKTMKEIRRKSSERHYWEELLKKHGSKNVKFYLAAGEQAIKGGNEIIYKRNDRHVERELKIIERKLLVVKETNSIKKVSKLEKEKELLISEMRKLRHTNFIDLMDWIRDNLLNAFVEFPRNKLLFKDYLKYEIIFRHYFLRRYQEEEQEDEEELDERLLAVRNGVMIDLIVNRVMKDFCGDFEYLREIRDMMRKYLPSYESDAFDRMVELVGNAPGSEEVVPREPAEPSFNEPMQVDDIDLFDRFRSEYRDLKEVRCKDPISFGAELHGYLLRFKEKMLNGELKRDEELPKFRSDVEWILNCDDWSSNSLDLWWDYYDIEKSCGDEMKTYMILQRAGHKLKFNLKNQLNLRRLTTKSK